MDDKDVICVFEKETDSFEWIRKEGSTPYYKSQNYRLMKARWHELHGREYVSSDDEEEVGADVNNSVTHEVPVNAKAKHASAPAAIKRAPAKKASQTAKARGNPTQATNTKTRRGSEEASEGNDVKPPEEVHLPSFDSLKDFEEDLEDSIEEVEAQFAKKQKSNQSEQPINAMDL